MTESGRFLLWQFTKPVLWASVMAWPLAYWAAAHWLNGFATDDDLSATAQFVPRGG